MRPTAATTTASPSAPEKVAEFGRARSYRHAAEEYSRDSPFRNPATPGTRRVVAGLSA
jgi:hypothetical protein